MTKCVRWTPRLLLLWSTLLSIPGLAVADLCPVVVPDDRVVSVHDAAGAEALRTSLRQYIWGQPSLPTDAQITVTPDVDSPVACDTNLDRVDVLRTSMGPAANGQSVSGWAWHFVPAQRRHRLVIVHNGHLDPNQITAQCATSFASDEGGFGSYGLQTAINALLAEGYDVLAVSMPLYVPDQCSGGHGALFGPDYAPTNGGHGMRYFLDTTLRSVNYLFAQGEIDGVDMLGLSGGGWTTTLYAAVDPRIQHSFPVAGSLPLYLRNGTLDNPAARPLLGRGDTDLTDTIETQPCDELGDSEQFLPEFYAIAGYPDLYFLGSQGQGREQVQILNRHDVCCFGPNQHADPSAYDADVREYEARVRQNLALASGGSFRLEIDEASEQHQISRNTMHNVILPALDGALPRMGAASSDSVFVRGPNSSLWHHAASGWIDLGFAINGVPAVIENGVHVIDVAVRDLRDRPMLLSFDGSVWQKQLLPVNGAVSVPSGTVVTDPVISAAGPGRFSVIAQGSDYRYYHWLVDAGGSALERADNSATTMGPPSLAYNEAGEVEAYFRDGPLTPGSGPLLGCIEQPRVLYSAKRSAAGAWQAPQRVGGLLDALGVLSGFPSAIRDEGNTRVYYSYVRGGLWEAAHATSAGAWQWSLPELAGASLSAGSPSNVLARDTGLHDLFIRDAADNLVGYDYDDQTSVAVDVTQDQGNGARAIDTPRNTAQGVYWTGQDGSIRHFDGSAIHRLDDQDTLLRADFEALVPPL